MVGIRLRCCMGWDCSTFARRVSLPGADWVAQILIDVCTASCSIALDRGRGRLQEA